MKTRLHSGSVETSFVRTAPSLAVLALMVSACGALFGTNFDERPGPKSDGGPSAPVDDVCEAGRSECNGDPTDGCETRTESDPAHCGDCEQKCEPGLLCGRGACVSTCPHETRVCPGGRCEAESGASCGTACVTCAAPAHGVGVCTNGGCDFTCDNGYERSGKACVAGVKHDTWTTVASMPTARSSLAVVAADGRIFAIGGSSGSAELATVEAYTPSTNTWVAVASMPTARSNVAAAVGADGRIFAIGGRGYNGSAELTTVEAYTPSTDTWAAVASMPTARGGVGVAVGADGRIFAIGGLVGSTTLSTVEVYTPGTNTWATVASMPTARDSLGVAVGVDGRIFAIGGSNGLADVGTVEVYTPGTNTWATAASALTGREGMGAARAADGRIFAIGGYESSTDTRVATVEAYVPGTNTWAAVASMPTARSYLGAAVAVDGRIFAIGGRSVSGVRVAKVEAYTP